MDARNFHALLNLVKKSLKRQNTVMRISNPTEKFSSFSTTYGDLKFSTGISVQALGYIIPETCRVIYESLRRKYIVTYWVSFVVSETN
jgi:hypothetical protein